MRVGGIEVGDVFRLPSGSVVRVMNNERPNHLTCAYVEAGSCVADAHQQVGVSFTPEFLLIFGEQL